MSVSLRRTSFLSIACALALTGCASQPIAKAATASPLMRDARLIADAGLKDEVGLDFVRRLTTEIGPRLAGSKAEAAARDWSMRELKTMGFTNVRSEGFTLPFWSRASESAMLLGDAPQRLVIAALGGSPSTPKGGIEAEIVRFETLATLEAAASETVTGKIVFIDEVMLRTRDGAGYDVAGVKRRRCAEVAAGKGASACLIRSAGTQPHRMAHTGIMARNGATGALPAAALSGPDADLIATRLEKGAVRLRLDIQVETAPSAPSGNVIAEIEGGDLKDEIILLGCHLDSWDLGTGALDDAAGCGIVVGAAKLIADQPGNPRRTIRVVLYGSEEVGLFGGDAYARAHNSEMSRHVFASESDFGAGRIWRLQTRFGEGALEHAQTLFDVLKPLGVEPGANDATGGPDIGVLTRAGVPVVSPNQDGTNYFDYHHTPDDTFDKINPDDFRQNVAVYAAMVWMVSEGGWDLRAKAPETPPANGS